MKYQVRFRETNRGGEICDIEKIDKYTKIYENTGEEGRFDVKVAHFDKGSDVVNFVYNLKLYISKDDAKEIVSSYFFNEFK